MRYVTPLICVLLLSVPSPTLADSPGDVDSERRQELIDLFRDLHAHPEIAGEEERTGGIVAERLRQAGVETRTGVGGHGVVGILKGGRPGPVVAYRADMDALEFPAPDPVPYASETPGVRHVCGHDMHTTIAIGLAQELAAKKEDLPGTVVFIFQPAEESAAGARAMLDDGIFDEVKPEAILALHCGPLEVGSILAMDELVLPGLDLVHVSLTGEGDLSAAAQSVAGAFASLNTLAPPFSAVAFDDVVHEGDFVVSGAIASEESPEENRLTVTGMIKANRSEVYEDAHADFEQSLAAMKLDDVTYEIAVEAEMLPAMVNDPELVRRVKPSLKSVVGDGLMTIEGAIPFFGEDFSWFQREMPGAMFFLGVSNSEKGTVGMPHSPGFVADEGAIFVGIEAMTRVLLDYMSAE